MKQTLSAAWQRTVRVQPNAVALIDAASGRTWSRRDLADVGRAWADQNRETVRGRQVAFGEPNGIAWLEVFLGLIHAEAVAVPLDPGEPPAARVATARTAGASHLWSVERGLEPLAAKSRRPRFDGRRLIKLTSGSTGRPRTLRFTDAQLLADGRGVCEAMGIEPQDLNLGLIPWGHSYGIGNLIMPLLQRGTPILAGVEPLPLPMANTIARWQPTVFPAVPALLQALARSSAPAESLTSLRTVITAGAPISPEDAQAFTARFGHKVHSFYGSTETGGITYDPTGELAATSGGVGWPLPGVRLAFTSRNRFTVRGPAVHTIGNRQPGIHRMADLGHFTPKDGLVLMGRSGRFVKIAGRRLNLAEVEHALRRLPGVGDAWAMAHPRRADALTAAVATSRPSAELRLALREHLAAWKIPKRLLAMQNFPLTARGKPDSRALRIRLSE